MSAGSKTGMVLGKFMPPHTGHLYLVEFARSYVDRLTVVVGSLQDEPIPGDLRFEWMKELFPGEQVVHLTDENPQHPSEHPDFWQIWYDSLMSILPECPDFLFASEDYGSTLAGVLGAEFIPLERTVLSVSGTDIRKNPLAWWDYLPRCVRPYYVKKVCLFGPESTGKTTLAKALARHFGTIFVPEYAHVLLSRLCGELEASQMELIAKGQQASERALSRSANRLLFCDTDLLTTTIWSRVLFGDCPQWILEAAEDSYYDLYLLLDVDVPWIDDVHRILPDNRRPFFEFCRAELERLNRRYIVLSGSWDERFSVATAGVKSLLCDSVT